MLVERTSLAGGVDEPRMRIAQPDWRGLRKLATSISSISFCRAAFAAVTVAKRLVLMYRRLARS